MIKEETETETERQSLSPEPDWNDYPTQPGSLAQSQTLPEPLIQFESLSLRMAQESGTAAAAVLNKEIKMNMPTPFTGKREKLEEFLIELEMYLVMNANIYNTDQWKIIFALLFMKEGTAGLWKQSYWKQTQEQMQLWDWMVFKNALTTSFAAPDKPGDAITKMETEMMTGRTADEFIKRFKINATDSGVMQDRPLIEWFMKGINVPLLDKILNLENPPTMIVDWYSTAVGSAQTWLELQPSLC